MQYQMILVLIVSIDEPFAFRNFDLYPPSRCDRLLHPEPLYYNAAVVTTSDDETAIIRFTETVLFLIIRSVWAPCGDLTSRRHWYV